MVISCGDCLPGLMKPTDSQRPWEFAACDLTGLVLKSKQGSQHVLVVVATKWVELFPLCKVMGRAVLDKLMEFSALDFQGIWLLTTHLISLPGCFARRVRSFRSSNNLCHPTNPVQPHQTFYSYVKSMLTAFVKSQKDCGDHVNELAFVILMAENCSTLSSFSAGNWRIC